VLARAQLSGKGLGQAQREGEKGEGRVGSTRSREYRGARDTYVLAGEQAKVRIDNPLVRPRRHPQCPPGMDRAGGFENFRRRLRPRNEPGRARVARAIPGTGGELRQLAEIGAILGGWSPIHARLAEAEAVSLGKEFDAIGSDRALFDDQVQHISCRRRRQQSLPDKALVGRPQKPRRAHGHGADLGGRWQLAPLEAAIDVGQGSEGPIRIRG